MASTGNVGRRLIAVAPFLLLAGIVAQVFLLAAILVLYVPCLIWPGILNGPYRTITKATARMFTRSMLRKGTKGAKVTEAHPLS